MRCRPSLRGALLWFLLQGINSCCCAEQTRFWLQQLAFIRHHTHKVSLQQRLQRKLSKVTAVSPASIQLSAEGSITIAGVKRSFGLADNQRMDSRVETSPATGWNRQHIPSEWCVPLVQLQLLQQSNARTATLVFQTEVKSKMQTSNCTKAKRNSVKLPAEFRDIFLKKITSIANSHSRLIGMF